MVKRIFSIDINYVLIYIQLEPEVKVSISYVNKLLSREIDVPDRQPKWLSAVRLLKCCRCGKSPAGTAHHIRIFGMGLKCSDFLTIPLCINCHVLGKEPVQGMTDERFLEIIGMTVEDAVRATFKKIVLLQKGVSYE